MFSYYIQYPNCEKHIFEPVNESQAISAFKKIDWNYEFSKFDPDRDKCRPGIRFHDKHDSTYLHICPCDDGTVDFTFGFPKEHILFRIIRWTSVNHCYVESFPIDKVEELISSFYAGEYDSIALLDK